MTTQTSLRNEAVRLASSAAEFDSRAEPSDLFFVEKIEEGLNPSQSLSPNEKKFLFMHATELTESQSLSPTQAKKLNDKCISALTKSYKKDTTDKNKKAALHWNAFNEWQYAHSECMVSGIVQNWYLSEGRSLEKKVVGFFGNPDW